LFLLVGGVCWLRGLAPQASFPAQFLSLTGDVTLVKVISISGAALVLWWLKTRFTYPRTGFVREKRVTAAQMIAFIGKTILALIFPALAVVAAFVFLPPVRASVFALAIWLPMVFGIFWAILVILAGEWMGLARFRWLGGWLLLAGIAVGVWQFLVGVPTVPVEALQPGAWAALPPALAVPLAASLNRTFASVGLLVLLTGVGLVASGGVTFLRYRKANPAPYQEEA
jgi:hypothetical protein